jgi:ABC-type polysaccharide/polyol phosphate export permease
MTSWREIRQEVLDQRFVLPYLVWRRLTIRFRRSFLGFLWSFLNPLLQMAVLTLVQTAVFAVEPARAFRVVGAGVLAFNLMRASALEEADAFVANQALIHRMPISKLVLVTAAGAAHLVEHVIALAALAVLLVAFGQPIHATAPLVVPLAALLAVASWGLGLALAGAVARFRDLRHVSEVAFQVWFFVTPIIYPASAVRPDWRAAFALNPFCAFLDGVNQAFVEGAAPGAAVWLRCATLAFFSAAAGLFVYRRVARRVAYSL